MAYIPPQSDELHFNLDEQIVPVHNEVNFNIEPDMSDRPPVAKHVRVSLHNQIRNLILIDPADDQPYPYIRIGMYEAYLVDLTDLLASPIRVATPIGIKSWAMDIA